MCWLEPALITKSLYDLQFVRSAKIFWQNGIWQTWEKGDVAGKPHDKRSLHPGGQLTLVAYLAVMSIVSNEDCFEIDFFVCLFLTYDPQHIPPTHAFHHYSRHLATLLFNTSSCQSSSQVFQSLRICIALLFISPFVWISIALPNLWLVRTSWSLVSSSNCRKSHA